MFRFDTQTRILITLCALLVTTILIWVVVLGSRPADRTIVAFLDIGQGDAIFIETPDHTQMLIDGGAGKRVLRELGEVMPFYDRSIDVVVATHPDRDHIGGLPHVLDRFDVGLVMRSGARNDTEMYRAFTERIEDDDIPVITPRRGMRITLGENTYFDTLFPDRDVSGIDPNAASIVGRLVYGESEVLLTGDAPDEIENYLAGANRELLVSDILKVGHHGSDTSTSQQFLAAVNPRIAVISAGADNTYGHPDGEVVERLRDFGVEIVSTKASGTVIFTSDGTQFYRTE